MRTAGGCTWGRSHVTYRCAMVFFISAARLSPEIRISGDRSGSRIRENNKKRLSGTKALYTAL
ncbi:hypothetical protein TNIN_321131, partial [Trichonephila inaurata madagascariensis]